MLGWWTVLAGQPLAGTPHRSSGTSAMFLLPVHASVQEGEDPALAQPVTENLNAVLQLLEYSAVSWARLGEGGVKEVFATAQARLPPC